MGGSFWAPLTFWGCEKQNQSIREGTRGTSRPLSAKGREELQNLYPRRATKDREELQDLYPRRATKDREELQDLYPRRATKDREELQDLYPRRDAKGREELKTFIHEGPRRTAKNFKTFIREGARRTSFFCCLNQDLRDFDGFSGWGAVGCGLMFGTRSAWAKYFGTGTMLGRGHPVDEAGVEEGGRCGGGAPAQGRPLAADRPKLQWSVAGGMFGGSWEKGMEEGIDSGDG